MAKILVYDEALNRIYTFYRGRLSDARCLWKYVIGKRISWL